MAGCTRPARVEEDRPDVVLDQLPFDRPYQQPPLQRIVLALGFGVMIWVAKQDSSTLRILAAENGCSRLSARWRFTVWYTAAPRRAARIADVGGAQR